MVRLVGCGTYIGHKPAAVSSEKREHFGNRVNTTTMLFNMTAAKQRDGGASAPPDRRSNGRVFSLCMLMQVMAVSQTPASSQDPFGSSSSDSGDEDESIALARATALSQHQWQFRQPGRLNRRPHAVSCGRNGDPDHTKVLCLQ